VNVNLLFIYLGLIFLLLSSFGWTPVRRTANGVDGSVTTTTWVDMFGLGLSFVFLGAFLLPVIHNMVLSTIVMLVGNILCFVASFGAGARRISLLNLGVFLVLFALYVLQPGTIHL
jgi:hypothetical protein